MPQAKYKLKTNNPPTKPSLFNNQSGNQTQSKNSIKKITEPKKFKVTGQQVRKDNPIQSLYFNLQKEKGQDPLIKNSHEKKIIHARESLKCVKNNKKDKKNTPSLKETVTSNTERFQKTQNQILEAQLPNPKMSYKPTNEPASS